MNRYELLKGLHAWLQPRTYVEIGVSEGRGLTLSQSPSVAIDPAFTVTHELQADVHLARTTSDEFFARDDPMAHLPIPVVDLAFINGTHLAEYVLRDFINLERYTAPTSVLVFDGTLPRTIAQAARDRHPGPWTGDVYKAVAALRTLREDLIVLEIDTAPIGTVVVLAPDPASRVLLDAYDDIVGDMVTPDPQDVPPEVLHRTRAVDPVRLLKSGAWKELRTLRDGRGRVSRPSVLDLYRRFDVGPTPP